MNDGSTTTRKYRILIVSQVALARYGLRQLIFQEPDLEVCGEVGDAAEALRVVEAQRPDLAVIGASLCAANGHGLIEHIKTKHSSLKVLAAIRDDDPNLAGRALHAGADGCIHWEEPLERIVEAIRAVLHGECYVGSHMAKRLLRRAVEGKRLDGNPSELFSVRELDVFGMIGQGLTTQQIARKLDLSPRTIESHRKNIKMKLGLQNAGQLNRCAFQWWSENN